MGENSTGVESEEWIHFHDMVQAANAEFARGEVGEVTKAIWSHSADATIFGGYGGFVEPGWTHVEARLTAAAKIAVAGTYSYHPLKVSVTGDSAYILQAEQYRFPGNTILDIRATIICQKEPDGWKIIHRHGELVKAEQ